MTDGERNVQGEIDEIEQELQRSFGGGPVPDQFVSGSAGRSETYHTQVCFRVANIIRQKTNLDGKGVLREISDSAIEYHGLRKCDACSTIESPDGERGRRGD